MTDFHRTSLYETHLAAGAKMVPFAGWEMPVTYEGVSSEHHAVRESCGIFDVSHMGQAEFTGRGAEQLLQRLLSNDVSTIDDGGAQYSCLCREDGGVLDDVFAYRLGDHFLVVTNAANQVGDQRWFERHAEDFEGASVLDVSDRYAMLAVQGPRAREVVAGLALGDLPGRFRSAHLEACGAPALVCGTGYTGEDGVELLVDPADAPGVWDAVVGAGAVPCGLAARDTLRLEACFHLYGNDLDTEHTPIEAGLGWCCKEETGFIGSEATTRVRAEGAPLRLVPFKLTGAGIPRAGNPVLVGGEPAGTVTSGTFSPSLEAGIGLAYVPASASEPGTDLEIDVRGRVRAARVETKPLYPPSAEG
ncbi:MAG: glycine cleavage system aminomethyltransferase GcvT [Solirubrobacterales bacterium]